MDYTFFVMALGLAVAVPAGLIFSMLVQIRDILWERGGDDWQPPVVVQNHYHLHITADDATAIVQRNGERPAALVSVERPTQKQLTTGGN